MTRSPYRRRRRRKERRRCRRTRNSAGSTIQARVVVVALPLGGGSSCSRSHGGGGWARGAQDARQEHGRRPRVRRARGRPPVQRRGTQRATGTLWSYMDRRRKKERKNKKKRERMRKEDGRASCYINSFIGDLVSFLSVSLWTLECTTCRRTCPQL